MGCKHVLHLISLLYDVYPSQTWGEHTMTSMDDHHRRLIADLPASERELVFRIDTHLRRVFDSMDDDFLKRAVNAEYGDDAPDSHWWDAVLQMVHCTVEGMGMRVDEFFADTLNEPHACYAAREYEQRLADGVYAKPVQKYRGETRYNTYGN